MTPDEIKSHLKRRPFQPIRVHISDGASHVIRHPEMAFVSRSELIIGLDAGANDIPEQTVYCDPLHVTRIEPLGGQASPNSPKGNGKPDDGVPPSSGAAHH
jgi:hypothetical protein